MEIPTDMIGDFLCKDQERINMLIGYARCSTEAQDTTGQVAALKEAGCKSIFTEKESGAKADRRQLAKALAALQADDVLVVTKLDRLARSMRDLLNTLAVVAERGAGFKCLDTPIDTTSPYGKLLIGVLGALAEFERSLILSRTKEGRQRYVANGGTLGRKPKLTQYQIMQAKALRKDGRSYAEIGNLLGVAHTTVSRAIGD